MRFGVLGGEVAVERGEEGVASEGIEACGVVGGTVGIKMVIIQDGIIGSFLLSIDGERFYAIFTSLKVGCVLATGIGIVAVGEVGICI